MSEFKVGDRVVSNGYYFGKLHDGCKGTVVRVSSYDCLVNFDDDVGGHTVCLMDVPIRHGLFVHHDNLTLVEREESKVMYASELMEAARKDPEKYEGKRYKAECALIDYKGNSYDTCQFNKDGKLCAPSNTCDWAYINGNTTLEEIPPKPKPVTFMEAVKAYDEGKTIECKSSEFKKRTYQPGQYYPHEMLDKYADSITAKEIINGEWFIKE